MSIHSEQEKAQRLRGLSDAMLLLVIGGHLTLDDAEAIEKLPEGWTKTPPFGSFRDTPILAIRLSGYTTSKYEILTVKYDPEYRPKQPWITLANDSVTDSGGAILGWRSIPRDWV